MEFNLQHLTAFFEIAKAGSFSAATSKLHTTQPALSRAIKNLEESLGYKLFSRHPRGVKLTSEGSFVLEHCHRIFRECTSISSLKPDASMRLSVAASENLCLKVFPNALGCLLKNSVPKNFSCEFSSGIAAEVIKNVTSGVSEIGYCFHSSKVPSLSFTPIAEVPFVVVAQPAYIKRHKLSFRTLSSASYIGSLARDYSGPNLAKTLLSSLSGQVATSIQSNSQEGQVQLAMAGLGYTLVPRFLVLDHLKQGKLQIVGAAHSTFKATFKATFKGTLFRVTDLAKLMTPFERAFEQAFVGSLDTD